MAEIYARHSGRSADEVSRDMERDNYFTPEEALDYRLIDSVVDRHELVRAPTGFTAR
jgi:ATP-dependent Clp protease protease subunit